jgi:RHH-type transcriptional regulator, rel operon repressor / antitoxin RelB
MISIELPPEIEERLDELAKTTGRSKAFYVREAVIEHLEDLEDIHLAEQRIAELRAGRSKTVPLEDVMKRYSMEG